jgi:hypothetical protein
VERSPYRERNFSSVRSAPHRSASWPVARAGSAAMRRASTCRRKCWPTGYLKVRERLLLGPFNRVREGTSRRSPPGHQRSVDREEGADSRYPQPIIKRDGRRSATSHSPSASAQPPQRFPHHPALRASRAQIPAFKEQLPRPTPPTEPRSPTRRPITPPRPPRHRSF